jgi:hypothetical protein
MSQWEKERIGYKGKFIWISHPSFRSLPFIHIYLCYEKIKHNTLKNNNKRGLYKMHEIPRCARNDSSFLVEGREKRRFVKKRNSIKNYRSNRRFSLFNNILACHSERSEESFGLFTIYLNFN